MWIINLVYCLHLSGDLLFLCYSNVVTKVIPLWEIQSVRILCNLDLLSGQACSRSSISKWWLGTYNQSHKSYKPKTFCEHFVFSQLKNLHIDYTVLIFNKNILWSVNFHFSFSLSLSLSQHAILNGLSPQSSVSWHFLLSDFTFKY